jgi:hypothetical protein
MDRLLSLRTNAVAGMNAVFTFKLSDLIAGLTPSNQWEWHGSCEAEFRDRWNANLTIKPISVCGDHLRNLHVLSKLNKLPVAQQLEEELLAAQTNGTTDATIVHKYEEETLGVTVGLRPQRYELFRTFVTLHFGRSDLVGRITTPSFVGFAASVGSGLIIPTYNEFLEGRPYLILDDCSIVFSAKPLP